MRRCGWTFSAAALAALALSGCLGIETPQVKDYTRRIASFQHSGLEASCVSCHEPDRPAIKAGDPWLSTHGNGQDCVSCHQPGAGWANGISYSHAPLPRSCTSCHEGARPQVLQYPTPVNTPTAGHFISQDCIGCHLPGGSGGATSFAFNHRDAYGKVMNTCLPCHEARRPSPTHNAGKDCASCHINPGVAWTTTVTSPHPTNSPTLTSCTTCHEATRPAITQYPAPGPQVSGHFSTQDCVACHNPKTTTLTTFVFSHNANGNSQTSCLPCHEGQRPTTTVYPPNMNRVAGHYSGNDCASCHRPKSATLTIFEFGHSNSLNQNINFCLPCHLSQGQAKHSGSRSVSFSGAGNCYNCHTTRHSFNAN